MLIQKMKNFFLNCEHFPEFTWQNLFNKILIVGNYRKNFLTIENFEKFFLIWILHKKVHQKPSSSQLIFNIYQAFYLSKFLFYFSFSFAFFSKTTKQFQKWF